MRVTVVGSGCVGPVPGACRADERNPVVSLGVDQAKIEQPVESGRPLFEPALPAERVDADINHVRLCIGADSRFGSHLFSNLLKGAVVRLGAYLTGLLAGGAQVVAYDPAATQETHRILRQRPGPSCASKALGATEDADALVMLTDWKRCATPTLNVCLPA
jgi:UDP-glucose 6-dehydrogenase